MRENDRQTWTNKSRISRAGWKITLMKDCLPFGVEKILLTLLPLSILLIHLIPYWFWQSIFFLLIECTIEIREWLIWKGAGLKKGGLEELAWLHPTVTAGNAVLLPFRMESFIGTGLNRFLSFLIVCTTQRCHSRTIKGLTPRCILTSLQVHFLPTVPGNSIRLISSC